MQQPRQTPGYGPMDPEAPSPSHGPGRGPGAPWLAAPAQRPDPVTAGPAAGRGAVPQPVEDTDTERNLIAARAAGLRVRLLRVLRMVAPAGLAVLLYAGFFCA